MKCKCNAKSLLQPVFYVFRTTFTMPSRNPPASTRRGKGFTKAETTTLLKAIERILPIDVEGWTEVHDIFNSNHSPRGVEGLKRKFNKLANKPVPTGNPNIPEDVKLAKSIKGKLFCRSGATLSDKEVEEEEDEEEEELDDDIVAETVDENIPSQPLITEAEVQEILNNEEEENNSTIAVEVSEEVTDTQATVIGLTYHRRPTRYTIPQPTGHRSSTIFIDKPTCSPNWHSAWSHMQEAKGRVFES